MDVLNFFKNVSQNSYENYLLCPFFSKFFISRVQNFQGLGTFSSPAEISPTSSVDPATLSALMPLKLCSFIFFGHLYLTKHFHCSLFNIIPNLLELSTVPNILGLTIMPTVYVYNIWYPQQVYDIYSMCVYICTHTSTHTYIYISLTYCTSIPVVTKETGPQHERSELN